MNDEYVEYLKKYLPSDELDEGIKKLREGISPQYIVGNVNFYGYNIGVDSRVLIPRFETELLVSKTIDYIHDMFGKDSCVRILDMGTGSGCIAISLKKEIHSQVVGVDVSSDALLVARKNAVDNQVDIDFVCSDLFSSVNGKFDVIISNPPYIREDEVIERVVLDNEPHIALFAKDNGLFYYDEILKNACKYLNDKFLIAFEIGQLQGDDVRNLVYKYFDDVKVFVEKDYSDRDRFVFVMGL